MNKKAKKRLGPMLFLSLFAVALLSNQTAFGADLTSSDNAGRPATVEDCINMTHIVEGLSDESPWDPRGITQWSPNGQALLVLLKKGNLPRNTADYSLVLFKASDLTVGISRPETLATLSSSSNHPAISHLKWIDDARFSFLGESAEGKQELYSFNLARHVLKTLLTWPTNILDYDVSPKTRDIVFIAQIETDKSRHSREIIVANQELKELLNIESTQPAGGLRGSVYIKKENGRITALKSSQPLAQQWPPNDFWQLSVSPDGNHAILQTKVFDIPREWEGYTNVSLQRVMHFGQPEIAKWVYQYLLLDLKTNTMRPLLNSPNLTHFSSRYLWSTDGASVYVADMFLPIDGRNDAEVTARKERPFVIEIKIKDGQTTLVTRETATLVRRSLGKDMLLLRESIRESGAFVNFKKTVNGWEEVARSLASLEREPTHIVIDENMNLPPRLVTEDPKRKVRFTILDVNPQFRSLNFGKVEEVKWKSGDGSEAVGGLYFPVNYVSGNKYPLVIQTHAWDANRFWIDGPYSSGYAAQPLAGKGFFVLQVGDMGQSWLTAGQGPRAMKRIEGAIDYLDQRGLIVRDRVGLVGFSATGYDVLFTITHSNYDIAAADNTDAGGGGYWGYMVYATTDPSFLKEQELQNGGPPFGANLNSWLKSAPQFNLDKTCTPLRIEPLTPLSALLLWEEFAGLTYLGRPVEMAYIPNGIHQLVRPQDREASMQGNVDWFTFWLKSEEDVTPDKADQYRRWRGLRQKFEHCSVSLAN
ncbi:MAG TPA: hypothetical protein VFK06_18005 [Candidatus Angelobacter sp.]|nr:hypothetical protein [Candidatus Angelobacter sp.]